MPADEADIVFVAAAAGDAGDDFAANDNRAGRVLVSELVVGGLDVPDYLPGPRVQRDDVCVVGRTEDLVVEDGERFLDPASEVASSARRPLRETRDVGLLASATTGRRGCRRRARAVFPDQIACRCVECLDHAARIRQIHDAVIDQRSGFLRSAVVHRPRPRELQLLDVLLVDLFERAVAPCAVGAPPVQPVAGRGIAEHGLRNRAEFFDLGGQQ
jgi:hypothetical protein